MQPPDIADPDPETEADSDMDQDNNTTGNWYKLRDV